MRTGHGVAGSGALAVRVPHRELIRPADWNPLSDAQLQEQRDWLRGIGSTSVRFIDRGLDEYGSPSASEV